MKRGYRKIVHCYNADGSYSRSFTSVNETAKTLGINISTVYSALWTSKLMQNGLALFYEGLLTPEQVCARIEAGKEKRANYENSRYNKDKQDGRNNNATPVEYLQRSRAKLVVKISKKEKEVDLLKVSLGKIDKAIAVLSEPVNEVAQ